MFPAHDKTRLLTPVMPCGPLYLRHKAGEYALFLYLANRLPSVQTAQTPQANDQTTGLPWSDLGQSCRTHRETEHHQTCYGTAPPPQTSQSLRGLTATIPFHPAPG